MLRFIRVKGKFCFWQQWWECIWGSDQDYSTGKSDVWMSLQFSSQPSMFPQRPYQVVWNRSHAFSLVPEVLGSTSPVLHPGQDTSVCYSPTNLVLYRPKQILRKTSIFLQMMKIWIERLLYGSNQRVYRFCLGYKSQYLEFFILVFIITFTPMLE